MLEMSTYDRVLFNNGEQAAFILACKFKLGYNWIQMAEAIGVNSRTLRDWAREKHRMSYIHLERLSKLSNITPPRNVKILQWSEHLKRAGKKGGLNQYAKNGHIGDETKRKKAWLVWWKREGKYKESKIFQRKTIRIPSKGLYLGEFVGIVMGDGGITDYAVSITLDAKADREYIPYVVSLIEKLFHISPKLYYRKKDRAVDIVVASKNLVEFCQAIGLKKGNKIKQNLDIPDWIKENTGITLVCIRGLVDTDGCFFRHSYRVNGKEYTYVKIAFTSKSPALLNSVRTVLIKLGFYVRMTKDGNDIRIESRKDVIRYMKIIGTHNPKFENKMR
jgi:hypothetical protein